LTFVPNALATLIDVLQKFDINFLSNYLALSNNFYIFKLMEEIAKVMARGLIALPSDVRKKLNLKEGDIVKVQVKDNQIILEKEERIYDLKGSIKEVKPAEKSFAQILQEELNKKRKEG